MEMFCAKAGGEMQQPEGGKRYRLGNYGAGTLWCLSNRTNLFILFNTTPIATRGRASLEISHYSCMIGWI